MIVKISLTNSKLGGAIPSVNLPPLKTCRSDAPCKNLCYAQKGNFNYKNVKESHIHNLACYINNSKKYFDDIIDFLNDNKTLNFFRWHSAGDIIDANYLKGMIKTAQKCKNVKFLCFTKKFEIVNDYLKQGRRIPKNLKIVFSAWDRSFIVNNPFKLPVTYVNFKDKSKNPEIPADAIECVGACYKCVACWQLVKGQSVVFNQH